MEIVSLGGMECHPALDAVHVTAPRLHHLLLVLKKSPGRGQDVIALRAANTLVVDGHKSARVAMRRLIHLAGQGATSDKAGQMLVSHSSEDAGCLVGEKRKQLSWWF